MHFGIFVYAIHNICAHLVYPLNSYVLPHARVDQSSFMAIGRLPEKIHAWQLGGKRQCTHRVHDKVNPEQLQGVHIW